MDQVTQELGPDTFTPLWVAARGVVAQLGKEKDVATRGARHVSLGRLLLRRRVGEVDAPLERESETLGADLTVTHMEQFSAHV